MERGPVDGWWVRATSQTQIIVIGVDPLSTSNTLILKRKMKCLAFSSGLALGHKLR